LCAEIPRVQTRTRFVIVRHFAERWKPSNSAHFARLAVDNCALVDYGDGVLDERQLTDGGPAWVLFPDGDAPPPDATPPARVIVLDGTWSQARRMRRRIQALRGLPFLRLPPPAVDRPRMRRPLDPGGMSTLEAIAGAVALLEGAERARPLEALHDRIARAFLARA
jgi:DTW domain-containing protein YfiP